MKTRRKDWGEHSRGVDWNRESFAMEANKQTNNSTHPRRNRTKNTSAFRLWSRDRVPNRPMLSNHATRIILLLRTRGPTICDFAP